jgi:hypothetical protein
MSAAVERFLPVAAGRAQEQKLNSRKRTRRTQRSFVPEFGRSLKKSCPGSLRSLRSFAAIPFSSLSLVLLACEGKLHMRFRRSLALTAFPLVSRLDVSFGSD